MNEVLFLVAKCRFFILLTFCFYCVQQLLSYDMMTDYPLGEILGTNQSERPNRSGSGQWQISSKE